MGVVTRRADRASVLVILRMDSLLSEMRPGADRGRTDAVRRRDVPVGADRGLIVVVVLRDPRMLRRDGILILTEKLTAFPAEHTGVLAVDPPSILLVDAGRAGQSPLGQRADGDETTDDGVRVLVPLGHRLDERTATVLGCLHGVVVVPSQHTRPELAYHLGALTYRANILGGHGAHARHARLAGIRVRLSILPVNRDTLRLTVLNVS